MQQPIQPLFQKGDKVVYVYIDTDGQVHPEICTVDDIILGDFIIYYELQELSEVVMESELMPLEGVETVEEEEDQFTFTQNFDYDDEVYVEGYANEIYVVKGIIIEIFRYKNEEWTEVSYELEREGLCIYAYDEDMRLVSEEQIEQIEQVEQIEQRTKSGRQGQSRNFRTEQSQVQDQTKGSEEDCRNINVLLDDYNDYIALYQLFGDNEYKELAESVIDLLKRQSSSKLV